MVVGTRTHVPTAYQTDIGMCGDDDSVSGMKKAPAIEPFVRKKPTARLEAADGEATLCATFVETDDETGLAATVSSIRIGGGLSQAEPNLNS